MNGDKLNEKLAASYATNNKTVRKVANELQESNSLLNSETAVFKDTKECSSTVSNNHDIQKDNQEQQNFESAEEEAHDERSNFKYGRGFLVERISDAQICEKYMKNSNLNNMLL